VTFDAAALYSALNATSAADLLFWTPAELEQYADEAAEALGRAAGVFVERDTATVTAAGTPHYATPGRHLSTLHVSLAGRSLRPVSVDELEAKDSAWRTASGTISHWARDAAGLGTITLYRVPDLAAALAVVYHSYPDVSAGAPIDAPAVLGDYLYFSAIEAARGREGQAAMPEVAQAAGRHAEVYRDLFQRYFGGAQ
jgi:hypothetical protein